MSTYPPDQLLQLWKLEQIDSQMVIGHLLQNLSLLAQRLTEQAQVLQQAEKRIHHLEQLANVKG